MGRQDGSHRVEGKELEDLNSPSDGSELRGSWEVVGEQPDTFRGNKGSREREPSLESCSLVFTSSGFKRV